MNDIRAIPDQTTATRYRPPSRKTHGHSCAVDGRPTSTYRSWQDMKKRCLDESHPQYSHYKHVKICLRWLYSFDAFLQDMGERPQGMTLDRVKNDKGYEPGNCRWATSSQQNRNKTNNVRFNYEGERLCLVEIAERVGIKYKVLHGRISSGWSFSRSITTPIRGRSR